MKIFHYSAAALAAAAFLALAPASFSQERVTIATDHGAAATTTTTTSIGTISEFSPDTIVMKSESSAEPLRYSYTKNTTYVDETGRLVSIETVRSGVPVTVHYIREGDRRIADRVIVHRHVTTTAPVVVEKTVRPPAAVEERRTTTVVPVPAPVIEEKKTTTTTTTNGR